MPVKVIMPKVDMDMAAGTLMTWHVAEGEWVEKGAVLFDIETDKAAMEVESPGSGTLHHTMAEGSEVPIGTAIGWLYEDSEDVGAPPEPSTIVAEGSPTETQTPDPTPSPAPAAPSAGKPRATPLARALAREAGVDLAGIDGTGARGRIQGDDVRTRLETPALTDGFDPESGPLAMTRSKGGTGTPVFLIHGFAGDAASWAPLEAHLKDRPLFRIDLPSHGKSPLQRISDFADLAARVRKAFDALDLGPAHVIGHSLGGALALALADTRPRNVASLTLIAPAGLGAEVNDPVLSGICRATRPASLGPWAKKLVADEALMTDAYLRIAMEARADPGLRAAQTAMADALFPDGVQAFDLRAALARIQAPTRIIWGKSDAIIPWQHALQAPGRVALHLFEGIGHIPQIEDPNSLGALLADLS